MASQVDGQVKGMSELKRSVTMARLHDRGLSGMLWSRKGRANSSSKKNMFKSASQRVGQAGAPVAPAPSSFWRCLRSW